MASPEPLQSNINDSIEENSTYKMLEEIHILALAIVLRRTDIVISDTILHDIEGQAMAPIRFGGAYLPFEIKPHELYRDPSLLAYNMTHFSPLVSNTPDQLAQFIRNEFTLIGIQQLFVNFYKPYKRHDNRSILYCHRRICCQ